VQATEELRLPFRVGPNEARRLTEKINRARRVAKALDTMHTAAPGVLANERAGLTGQRAEQAEFVVLV